MPKIDLSAIAADLNMAEEAAAKLAPLLAMIPGLGPYAPAITQAIPAVVKATHVLEEALGLEVGMAKNTAAVVDVIDPTKTPAPEVAAVLNAEP